MFELYSKTKFKRLQHTLMIAFLVLSITPLTGIALFFLHSHSSDLREQSTSHLVSIRDAKKQQTIDYIEARQAEVLGFVRSELAYASGGRFYGLVNAFQSLGLSIEQAREQAQNRYIPGSGDELKTRILPQSPLFNGSERYRLLHKRYHWGFLELLERSDFDDILLVDLEGNVTYSIYKHDYFGTNLQTGAFQLDSLGRTFAQLTQQVSEAQHVNKDATPIVLSDFSQQDGATYAWFGAPIIQQGYLHSYALFRLPNQALSELIAPHNQDEKVTTLLVGHDYQSRVITLESRDIELSREVIEHALLGDKQVGSYRNALEQKILAAYAPIEVAGLHWAIVTEVAEGKAFARVHQLIKVFVVTMLIALVLVIVASHYLSNFITAPLLKLTWAAEKASAGDLEQAINHLERKDEVGRLAVSFERMRRSIRDKIQLINNQNQALEDNLALIQKQNDELQIANKLKDEFLATTSHELRTPLHGMVGIAEALIAGASGPISAEHRYQLDIIVSSGQRLTNLVDDLLDYHKMRYGSLDIHPNAVNIASATRLVLELSHHLLGNKPIRIINQVEENLWVYADPQRIEQVLYNLIGNAIKYTSEGKIVISTSQIDDQIRIQIVDTGQGIPTEQLEHIFEPLIQAGKGAAGYRQGAGLGLSISRQLVELMHGALYVSSQPMLGTTMSFTLPAASKTQIEQSSTAAVQPHFEVPMPIELGEETLGQLPVNPNGAKILIADDEPVNVRVLESFLRLEGYQVTTAYDGQQALEQIKRQQPDLVLLDVMMPEMNGYQVCRHLRERFDHAELPIIMLTALNQAEDKIKGFSSGANDFLSKPFNKPELAARIRAHLQASNAELRREENHQLQQELKQRLEAEANLLDTQQRLLEQLDCAPEAIVCVHDDLKIKYANLAAARLLRRPQEQLLRSFISEFVDCEYLEPEQPRFCGQVKVRVGEAQQTIASEILTLAPGSGLRRMYIFDLGATLGTSRVQNLESALEALSSYAFEGDRDKLAQLQHLGSEFDELSQKAKTCAKSQQEAMRETLVEAMNCGLQYWEETTGRSKFSFAEESGLWRVYLDRSTLQTRTLDKYLRVETLPKSPRWRTVLSSLEFILAHEGAGETPERLHIQGLRDKLKNLITT
ncbi:response regulator [Vibrio sp. WXL210]|uniref:response regulator n=1 Tax=Vibrio sp. WXL210 TaxID=3450709 RepID=UPI003EC650E2